MRPALCFSLLFISLGTAALSKTKVKTIDGPGQLFRAALEVLKARPEIMDGLEKQLDTHSLKDSTKAASLRAFRERLARLKQVDVDNDEERDACDACELAIGLLRGPFNPGKEIIIPIIEAACVDALREELSRADYFCQTLVAIQGNIAIDALLAEPRRLRDTRVCQLFNTCIYKDTLVVPPRGRKKTSSLGLKRDNDKAVFYRQKAMEGLKPRFRHLNIKGVPRVSRKEIMKDTKEIMLESTNVTEETTTEGPVYESTAGGTTSGQREATTTPPGPAATFTVVQLTDIHINPEYTVGSATDCGMYVCCYSYYPGEGSAGSYGDYKCNIPQRTIELFLDKVKELEPRPEFILYSGDNPPHQMHNETYDFQLGCTENLLSVLQTRMDGWTIYPAIGNHEMFPTNIFSMSLGNTKSMTARFGELWTPFADFKGAQNETWNKGGYYTVLTKIPRLRIVAFNTNYGYTLNFYNAVNFGATEYEEQFTFLNNTLQKAKEDGEKVILLGHHPPGESDTCYLWGRRFTQLIRDFRDVIVLQVYGHTHNDHFQMFTDEDGETPASVAFISPSISSSIGVNPSMRIFTFDNETYELVDFEQYFLDLEKANSGQPEIVRSYSAKAAYDLPDMSPASWSQVANRLETDDDLFDRYLRNYVTRVNQTEQCDHECRAEHVCRAQHSSYDRYLSCFYSKTQSSTEQPSVTEATRPTDDVPEVTQTKAPQVTVTECPSCPIVDNTGAALAPSFLLLMTFYGVFKMIN